MVHVRSASLVKYAELIPWREVWEMGTCYFRRKKQSNKKWIEECSTKKKQFNIIRTEFDYNALIGAYILCWWTVGEELASVSLLKLVCPCWKWCVSGSGRGALRFKKPMLCQVLFQSFSWLAACGWACKVLSYCSSIMSLCFLPLW